MYKKLRTEFSTRQHMLSEDFEVYYYNDPHYTPTSEHAHNYYELYFFLQGDIELCIDDQVLLLKYGDIIIIPPGVTHHAKSRNPDIPYRRFIMWITPDYYQEMINFSDSYKYLTQYALNQKNYIHHLDTYSFNIVQSKLFQLIEELHYERFGRDAQITLNFMDLCLYLNRLIYEKANPQYKQDSKKLYKNLLMYIDEHLSEDLSLDCLAKEFFVSKYHIAHLFKNNLGIPVHQYILKKRLDICKQSLLNDSNISKTCLLYGFKDYSTFYRSFKKEYGISPKEYKEMHKLNIDSNYI